jgi:hypothetical protein
MRGVRHGGSAHVRRVLNISLTGTSWAVALSGRE